METEVDEKKVEIESGNSKTEEDTSEGESEKENVSAEEVVNSVEGAAEEITKEDSFFSAACAVIGSTNALISSLVTYDISLSEPIWIWRWNFGEEKIVKNHIYTWLV